MVSFPRKTVVGGVPTRPSRATTNAVASLGRARAMPKVGPEVAPIGQCGAHRERRAVGQGVGDQIEQQRGKGQFAAAGDGDRHQ